MAFNRNTSCTPIPHTVAGPEPELGRLLMLVNPFAWTCYGLSILYRRKYNSIAR